MELKKSNLQFGEYGGRYVPETLTAALDELTQGFVVAQADPNFRTRLEELLKNYAGRPTPLYHAAALSKQLGVQLYLKREDLLHTGSHKINNALGQALLAQALGKRRIVAETGAGQHGVASATVCALLGLECVVYMGVEDMARQAVNVERMRLLGARINAVSTGSRTLKDAVNEAIRDWVTNVDHTHYLIGSVIGPHPYPTMVREFQSVIGREAHSQFKRRTGSLPDLAIACVGGGSNAAGLFHQFLDTPQVTLIGVEAGGHDGVGAASLNAGQPGVLHGARSYILQDADGQILPTNSVSAGLDYPGVGPEHAYWRDEGRVKYVFCGDAQALHAFRLLAKSEGILPALEPAHALGYLVDHVREVKPNGKVLLLLSGRGDKDLQTVLATQT